MNRPRANGIRSHTVSSYLNALLLFVFREDTKNHNKQTNHGE